MKRLVQIDHSQPVITIEILPLSYYQFITHSFIYLEHLHGNLSPKKRKNTFHTRALDNSQNGQ